jgi:hypothetical protein
MEKKLKCWKKAPNYLQGDSEITYINKKTKEQVWVQKIKWIGDKRKPIRAGRYITLSSKNKSFDPITQLRNSAIKKANSYMKKHDKC